MRFRVNSCGIIPVGPLPFACLAQGLVPALGAPDFPGGGRGEEPGPGGVVKEPDGGEDGEPVQKAEVSGKDQQDLEEDLGEAVRHARPSEWHDGQQGAQQLDDVVAENLELVPLLGGVVRKVGVGVGIRLSLVEVVHAAER